MTTQRDSIRAFIASNFYVADVDSLSDDTSLLDQGIVDSTGILEVTSFLESTYGIKVSDHEIVPENLDTIANIVAFVQRKTEGRSGARVTERAAQTGA